MIFVFDTEREETYQRGNEINTWHIVNVVNFDVTSDTFVATALDGAFKYVSVVEVLHRLRAEIDAEMLQLARLRILEPEHVQDTDETVRGMSHGVIQGGHASRSCSSWKILILYLIRHIKK